VSIAWSPGKSRKTVLRTGAGLFYETTGMDAVADTLRYNGLRLRQFVTSNPSYPNPLSGGPAEAQPNTIVRFARALKAPYLLQYSAGVERELVKSTSLTATYLGTRGVGLFRSRNINSPLPPFYERRPDPSAGVLQEIESAGRLEGHSAKISLQGKITKYFSGMTQYTFERVYDNTTGIGYYPGNQYDLTGEWAPSSANRRHGIYTYGSLSVGKLFKLGIVFMAYSGKPYTITTGRDNNGDTFANDRPVGVARNTEIGPGFKMLDLRWSRDFRLRPRMKEKSPSLTLSVDAFNVANWSNMSSIVGNLSSPFFGQSVSAMAARRLQGTLRIGF
jgi:hypothetical protein